MGVNAAALGALLKGDLTNFAVAATPGGIEAQEAAGQKGFVNSQTLPTEFNSPRVGGKEILEAAGVKFLGPVEGDPLFQRVELPNGWRKVATDHSMWSRLVDDQGRERAAIFFKAAFYDYSAHINLTTRYHIRSDYEREKEGSLAAHALDGEKVLYSCWVQKEADDETGYHAMECARGDALAWMKERYPDFENPAAYW